MPCHIQKVICILLRYKEENYEDENEVGKIVNHLEKNGLRENTIIFYASDNGGSPRTAAYNGGLAGCKYTLAEGGIRIPYFVSWPGKIKAGLVSNKPVITLDIFPTAMAAATGKNNASPQCDGINLLPFLCGKEKLQDRNPIGWQAKSEYALRHGKWKLYNTPRNFKVNIAQVIPQNKRLFDLENDPRQENNLYLTMPEKALEMEQIVYKSLLNVHNIAEKYNDPQFADFIEGEYLEEQVSALNEISKYVSQLKRIGENGHGVWNFDSQFGN